MKKKTVKTKTKTKKTAKTKKTVVKKQYPPAAPVGDKAQVVIRKDIICEMCGARNSFVKICGVRAYKTFGQSYARCGRCGHRAHIRVISQ